MSTSLACLLETRPIISNDRFKWTMRILGFVLIVTLGCANLVGYLTFLNVTPSYTSVLEDLAAETASFKSLRWHSQPENIQKSCIFNLYCIGSSCVPGSLHGHVFYSFYVQFIANLTLAVLTYINVSSNFAGINPNFSFYLVSIVNASSGLGRILAGALADRFGTDFSTLRFSRLV